MHIAIIIKALALLLSPEQIESTKIQDVAIAIAASNPSPTQAALMITGAWHESNFHPDIIAGGCSRYGCDEGRARGIWQLHRSACPKAYEFEAGTQESLLLEAQCAKSLYGWALAECKTVPGAFAMLGGLACSKSSKFEVRKATYEKLLKAVK